MNPVKFYTAQSWRVTSPYGYRIHPITGAKQSFHNGVDFGDKPHGHPIQTPYPGTVIAAQFYESRGNTVVIKLGWGSKCHQLCQHLSAFNVKVGDKVNPGDVIGFNGDTGNSFGAHLHYELRWAGNPWGDVWGDPAIFILEDDEMEERALVLNDPADYPAAKPLADKFLAGIYSREVAEKRQVAREIIICGGGRGAIRGEKFIDLSGADRWYTSGNIGDYYRRIK